MLPFALGTFVPITGTFQAGHVAIAAGEGLLLLKLFTGHAATGSFVSVIGIFLNRIILRLIRSIGFFFGRSGYKRVIFIVVWAVQFVLKLFPAGDAGGDIKIFSRLKSGALRTFSKCLVIQNFVDEFFFIEFSVTLDAQSFGELSQFWHQHVVQLQNIEHNCKGFFLNLKR